MMKFIVIVLWVLSWSAYSAAQTNSQTNSQANSLDNKQADNPGYSQTPDPNLTQNLDQGFKQSFEAVYEAFVEGQFEQAQEAAQALQTADGYALAAEVLAARILIGDVDRLNKKSKIARDWAQQALDIDPDHQNAHLQYTLTDGFVTRTSGVIKAWRKKLPTKTRDVVLDYQKRFPNDPRGNALIGAWHLGVIRKAGEANGSDWYGASLREGIDNYEVARQALPDDILILSNYAMALLVLGPEDYREPVRTLLETVKTLTPQSEMERRVQARSQLVLDNLSDDKRSKKAAERFLDGDRDLL